MKKPLIGITMAERKWFLPLIASTLASVMLLLTAVILSSSDNGTRTTRQEATSSLLQLLNLKGEDEYYVEGEMRRLPNLGMPSLPKLAYLISGTKGDGQRMQRLLWAVYHPRNEYLLHLDLEAAPRERIDLSRALKLNPLFVEVGNVHVIAKANLVTYRGPTMIACTLHAASILLRKSLDWDWFINLSASDYPLVTQDDLLHALSYLPRDLNFIEHTSEIGWKEFQRAKPVIIDPGLYSSRKSDIVWASQRRSVPDAFKLFAGSAWVLLSRPFLEYCIWAWDNLPRVVLMYYANFVSSPEGYFHTVICNSNEFRNTTVNHDLHYIAWDTPPKQHPLTLSLKDLHKMRVSGAAFARKFERDDSAVLDRIDRDLLGKSSKGHFTPGGWCVGSDQDGNDPCSVKGNPSILKPGPGAKRLEGLILKLLEPKTFRENQCATV